MRPEAGLARTLILSLLALLLLQFVAPETCLAHGGQATVSSGTAVCVTFSYEDNQPMAGERFEVFTPDNLDLYLTGQTDPQGRAYFRPDRQGRWQVRVWTEDGHGTTAQVPVDDLLAAASSRPVKQGLLSRIVIGVSVIFGIFGVLVLATGGRR